MTILSVAGVVFIAALAHFLPFWTRSDIYFAVTVDPQFRGVPAARRILLRYRLIVWASAAAGVALQAVAAPEWPVMLVAAGFLYAIVDAHRCTIPFAAAPATAVEVDLSAPVERFPGGPLVMFLPIVALSGLTLWVDWHWDELPMRLPIHWGVHGPDRWIQRTHSGVSMLLAFDAVLSVALALFAWGIFHWSRRNSTGGARAATERRFRRLNAQMLLILSWMPVAMAWTALVEPDVSGSWFVLLVTGLVAVYLVILIRYRQGSGDRAPDACWKLGLFYYNPADPAIFIPKRIGLGYTVNFANRRAWLLLGAVLVPVVLANIFLK